ncbi:MAG: fumarylacetoacetate hydrolase family protein [Thermodesulfobacteriota bacterium]
MKLVTYSFATVTGEPLRIGALLQDKVVDLKLAYARYLADERSTGRPYEIAEAILPPDMLEFLKGGVLSMDAARRAIEFVGKRLSNGESVTGPRGERIVFQRGGVKLKAPVPRPNSIRDTMSFEGHMKDFDKGMGKPMPDLWYQNPVYYKGNPCTVIGPDEPILWPSYTDKLDFELEFGIYIGKQGKDIRADEAQEYIAGYTIFNDISARDIMRREISLFLGPAKGKDMDSGNIMGPCLVTSDELDATDMKLSARINGETWAEGRSSDMYWSFGKIIEYISRSETLYPGDFIGSGTVPNGCGDELNRWIQPGDVIELEVEGIGILRNTVEKRTGS